LVSRDRSLLVVGVGGEAVEGGEECGVVGAVGVGQLVGSVGDGPPLIMNDAVRVSPPAI
jgi:hypothetical protein